MTDIRAILIVPERGDPHKLLGAPKSIAWKCGARPPTAVRVDASAHTETKTAGCFEACVNDTPCPDVCAEEGIPVCDWCGEAWPCANAGEVERPHYWVAERPRYHPEKRPRALVLAWDGEVVWAASGWVPDTGGTQGPEGHVPGWAYSAAMLFAGIYEWADVAADLDTFGTPIALDADGREVDDG